MIKNSSLNYLPREIEVKIIRRVPRTLPEFAVLMRRVGARLITPRRLLSDRRFKLHTIPSLARLPIPPGLFVDIEAGRRLLQYLGVAVESVNGVSEVFIHKKLPARIVRLRVDGATNIWTVKESQSQASRYKVGLSDRTEVEAEITSASTAEKIIEALGYRLASQRQKFRVTYQLKTSLIEWNECPAPSILPWLEVESQTRADVFAAVLALGFSKADTAAMSEAEYLSRSGLSKAAVRHLVFASLRR